MTAYELIKYQMTKEEMQVWEALLGKSYKDVRRWI